ncbi:MAG: thiamine pyrophosphate-dependent enzyme, partial [Acidobacteriota bacterium]
FCRGKKAVLVVEESQPDFIEQAIHAILRRGDVSTQVMGKSVLPMAGEYTSQVVLTGLQEFLRTQQPHGMAIDPLVSKVERLVSAKKQAADLLGNAVPSRPPTFCTGCPERPVFSAIKIVDEEMGPTHVSADIGCHSFATLAPFNVGSTIMGYGLSLASSSAVASAFNQRVISIMGDGGFWHNGLSSGVTNAVFNNDDSILVIMKNGYSAATGWQYLPSSKTSYRGVPAQMSIEKALKTLGVEWVETIRSYDVSTMAVALRRARSTKEKGLKVIVADGECQLARQRRVRAAAAERLTAGKRLIEERFGVDDEVCTGDHSCIRLSGCPSLTIKDSLDALRTDTIATIDQGCVGCGLCGEVAHAARLCPSFYRTEIIKNPSMRDRLFARLRSFVIHALGSGRVGESSRA